MRSSATAVCLCAIILLAGCVSAGNTSIRGETAESIGETLAAGQTMAEVRAALGNPMITSTSSDGLATWTYSFTELEYRATSFIPVVGLFDSGVSTDSTTLQIVFDEDGLVSEYTITETEVEADTSILN